MSATVRGMPDTEDLVSVTEAARICKVDPATIKRRIYGGRLPAERFGRMWMIHRDDLKPAA